MRGYKDDVFKQLDAAPLFLDQNTWTWEQISCEKDVKNKKRKTPGDPEKSTGVVFAMEHRLEALRKHGRLTLLDSTHKANHEGW